MMNIQTLSLGKVWCRIVPHRLMIERGTQIAGNAAFEFFSILRIYLAVKYPFTLKKKKNDQYNKDFAKRKKKERIHLNLHTWSIFFGVRCVDKRAERSLCRKTRRGGLRTARRGN